MTLTPSDSLIGRLAPRCYWWVGWAILVSAIALHILGAGPLKSPLWGVDVYAFLPPYVLWLAAALLVAGALAISVSIGNAAGVPAPAKGTRRLLWAGGVVLSFAIFWGFREAHTLLGDGHPLTLNLPKGLRFHPDEPLAVLIHHWFYVVARPLFAARVKDPVEIARDTVALSSALAGVAFVPIAWSLARELASSFLGRVRSDEPVRLAMLSVPLFVLFLAQGCIELFFGYVEDYTVYLLALGAYMVAAYKCLEGRAPLVLPGALLVIATALHLSGALFGPSFAVLAWHSFTRPGKRLATLRDLALTGLCFTLMAVALAPLSPGYNLAIRVLGLVNTTNPHSSYVFSRPGPGAFLNEQLLIGPVGIFLFVPALLVTVPVRRLWSSRLWLSACMGTAYVGASVIAGGSNLGDARNWDLLAPAGFVLTVSGADLALLADWKPGRLWRWVSVLALVSLFHTIPWVAVNASFDRSFARFKTLPLGLGRMQAVVGSWYLSHGQDSTAVEWYRRSLNENPRNNQAAYGLGVVAMRRHDYMFAAQAFWSAMQDRGGMDIYRFGLADALLRLGYMQRAVAQFDTLVRENPTEPAYWVGLSLTHLALGHPLAAQSAFAKAEQLGPSEPYIAVFRRDLSGPVVPEQLLEDWATVARY